MTRAAGLACRIHPLPRMTLIELNRYSISPHYANAVREAEYDPSADDLVKLNRYDIATK